MRLTNPKDSDTRLQRLARECRELAPVVGFSAGIILTVIGAVSVVAPARHLVGQFITYISCAIGQL